MNSVAQDPAAQREATPGQPAMWTLVMIEALTFSSYFVVYAVRYRQAPELFLQSQSRLDLGLGVLNTIVLLTSSWAIASCVQSARAGDYSAALRGVWLTVAGGALFCAMKLYEWSVEIGRGLAFTTNEFFSFYYFLTGMHLLHVLGGFIALGIIVFQLRGPGRRSQELVETCATYWHMVDFLWVIIFALLYVMR